MHMKNTRMSFDLTLRTDLEEGIRSVTEGLKTEGFGILTRIDFDQKIKEKLGKSLPRSVILGACNPNIAYEAYLKSPDMLLMIPCNVVLEERGPGELSVRFMKPSAMLDSLDRSDMALFAREADEVLRRAVEIVETPRTQA